MTQALTQDQVQQLRKEFDADPRNRLMQNAVTRTPVDDVALDRAVVTGIDHSFSHVLDDWTVTNQKKSGRCWLFAGLNLLRVRHRRAAWASRTSSSPRTTRCSGTRSSRPTTSSRRSSRPPTATSTTARSPTCSSDPTGDGGQWNMFVNLVRKHGLVPKAAMPETQSSSHTGPMNAILRTLLRQGARDLRALAPAGRRGDAGVKEQLAGDDLPHPLHPPRHAAGAVPLAVDRQGPRLPPRRRDDAAGVRRAATSTCRWTTTSAWCTTRGRAARSAGPSRSSTSATSSGRHRQLPQRRHRPDEGR